mmetsp:Transcript_6698/g.18603  ORF Transcript_6698/g.18603 Transcript_6698/m.18603 type:complete len:204 (+) Transcript_6698:3368-3979(+)
MGLAVASNDLDLLPVLVDGLQQQKILLWTERFFARGSRARAHAIVTPLAQLCRHAVPQGKVSGRRPRRELPVCVCIDTQDHLAVRCRVMLLGTADPRPGSAERRLAGVGEKVPRGHHGVLLHGARPETRLGVPAASYPQFHGLVHFKWIFECREDRRHARARRELQVARIVPDALHIKPVDDAPPVQEPIHLQNKQAICVQII